MNFLAHVYLSGNNDHIKIGNFIADAVKGSHFSNLPADIQKGIILHRFIDNYTDHSPLLNESRSNWQKEFPKFYSSILDICFDHFLAKNWSSYSQSNLRAYTRNIYLQLILNYRWLPQRVRRSLPFLITQNWLESYKEVKGIGLIFDRMNKYRGLPWDSEPIIKYLNSNYNRMEQTFFVFFESLMQAVEEKKIIL